MLSLITLFVSAYVASFSQGLPVVNAEKDWGDVYVAMTTLKACGLSSPSANTMKDYNVWVAQHDAALRKNIADREKRAAAAYSNPQAKQFVCQQARAAEGQFIKNADVAMRRVKAAHATYHR